MSIATELAKLQTARNKIRTKLVALGLVAAAAKLDDCATAVDGISNQGAVSATVQEGDTYTIPAGYHNGSGTVSGVAGGGNYKLQSKTVAPTKAQQAITPDSGYYGLSDVTVSQIPDAYQDVSSVTAGAADTLTGKVLVTADGKVTTGTMPNNGAVSKTLDANTPSYTIPKGYHSGTGKVSVAVETKNGHADQSGAGCCSVYGQSSHQGQRGGNPGGVRGHLRRGCAGGEHPRRQDSLCERREGHRLHAGQRQRDRHDGRSDHDQRDHSYRLHRRRYGVADLGY